MSSEQSYSQSYAVAADDLLLRRYRVMGSCGTGGFGTVLACWDTRLQRRVAIKRMRLALSPATQINDASAEFVHGAQSGIPATARMDVTPTSAASATIEEALTEARTASRLSHVGIVAVHDFAVEDGVAYLVMEYVDGLNLAELLARVEGGKLTHDEAAYLVQQLGSAIAFAHHEGVLHLDIKPSNIMFTHDGTVKLCDFGMATLASAAGYAEANGGTVGYMPPEQIEGGMVDERTDVFGMAVVLAQALTGVCPFAAQTAEQSCALVRRGPKPKLSRLDPDLGGMAEHTLLACLSPDPAVRPPDASAIANDLAFGLGDPEAGAQSLASLLEQLDTAVDDSEPEWDGERLPLYYRYPQLFTWIVRAVSGCFGAEFCYLLIPHLPLPATIPRALAALVVGVVAALWQPLASLAGVGMLVAALAFGASATGAAASMVMLLTIGAALVLGIWWAAHLRNKTASIALLCAAAVGQPSAAPYAAAATERPLTAVITTGCAWLLAILIRTALSSTASYSATQGLAFNLDIFAEAFSLTGLIALAGFLVAAAAGALITKSGPSIARGVLGQFVCCAASIFFQLLARRMENGGIWPAPSWDTVGIAVVLGAVMCIAISLRGPRDTDMEDEDLI